MQKTKRWIVIGASGTLGLGLVAGGALAAANAFELRDVPGTVQPEQAGTVSGETPAGIAPASTSSPATPTASTAPSASTAASPTQAPQSVSPATPVSAATPPTPASPVTPASAASAPSAASAASAD
ncbi:hypothetical protein [Agromyces sp. ZXT2-6]|uniref:hypothetical protein n=1 Tax=Agromyces sp. ZXT2-6 TaxID=3461153 RepID=UPI004054E3F8